MPLMTLYGVRLSLSISCLRANISSACAWFSSLYFLRVFISSKYSSEVKLGSLPLSVSQRIASFLSMTWLYCTSFLPVPSLSWTLKAKWTRISEASPYMKQNLRPGEPVGIDPLISGLCSSVSMLRTLMFCLPQTTMNGNYTASNPGIKNALFL